MRMLSQNVREPRRGAEEKRDEADEIRILPQQRQEAATAAQAGEEMIERGQEPHPDFLRARTDR